MTVPRQPQTRQRVTRNTDRSGCVELCRVCRSIDPHSGQRGRRNSTTFATSIGALGDAAGGVVVVVGGIAGFACSAGDFQVRDGQCSSLIRREIACSAGYSARLISAFRADSRFRRETR
jgi:hypothetical protein